MTMRWHDSSITRKKLGDAAEQEFARVHVCSCGGHFSFIGDVRAGFPDFTCDHCGRLVDVKSSPQSEKTGNISVSAIPWQRYPEDMLLVTCIGDRWIGEYKRNIHISTPAREPTHDRNIGPYGNTRWYLIPWRDFRDLEQFGIIRSDSNTP